MISNCYEDLDVSFWNCIFGAPFWAVDPCIRPENLTATYYDVSIALMIMKLAFSILE